MGQLIAVIAASDYPSQTTHNVKITFAKFYFLKVNECK